MLPSEVFKMLTFTIASQKHIPNFFMSLKLSRFFPQTCIIASSFFLNKVFRKFPRIQFE